MPIQVRCPSCGKVSQYSASDAGFAALCVACGARMVIRPDEGSDAGAAAAAAHAPPPFPPAGNAPPPPASPADSAVTLDAVAELAEPAGAADWGTDQASDGSADDDAARAAADALAVALGGALAPLQPRPGAQSPFEDAPAAPAPVVIPSGYAPRPPIAPMAGAAAATPPPYDPNANAEGRGPRRRHPLWLYGFLGGAAGLVVLLFVVLLLATRPGWDDKHAAEIRELKSQAEGLAARDQFQEAYDTYGRLDALVAGHGIRDTELLADIERARRDRDWLFKTMVARASNQYATVRMPSTRAAPSTLFAEGFTPGVDASTTVTPVTSSPTTSSAFPMTATAPTSDVARAAPAPARLPPAANWLPRPEIRVRRVVVPAAAAGANANTNGAATVTDEQVGRSIQRGVDFLVGQFQRGKLHGDPGNGNDARAAGEDALCVYALLQASLAINDPRLNARGPLVRDMLDSLKAMPITDRGPATYARALRASALALGGRQEDRAAMLADVGYLTSSHMDGAYTYAKPPGKPDKAHEPVSSGWDNSNSQYGLLGVWAGAEVGAEVSPGYWRAVEDHWTRWQCTNGSWEYMGTGGTGRITMGVAGVASLFVTHDYIDAPKITGLIGRPPFSPPLARGLEYLEAGDNALAAFDGSGYGMYGLERVGLASGFKYFGNHDWYRAGAARLVSRQAANGSWGGGSASGAPWDADVEAAFNLLFLSRGRHPVVMSKLRYEGSWANRPRDLANLVRFGTREIEHPLNWQVVPLDHPWTDWTDAPILYIASHENVAFGEDDLGKFRSYVENGGMLFTQADGGRPEADRWAQDLAKRLFPDHPMTDLPEDHALFRVMYQPEDRPPLRQVTNGSRILMLHSSSDISQHWQTRNERNHRGLFELGMNIILYASGKGEFRNRLALPVDTEPAEPAGGGRVAVARVRYAGNWDPEPGAWPRFKRFFRRETDVGLDVTPTALTDLNPRAAGFAHWTGTAAYTPSDAEIDAIRRYVTDGGVLLVEPTGGGGEFYASATAALRKALPDAQPQMVPKTHPMLTASGPAMDDLSKPRTRLYVRARGLGTGGRIDAITAGRGRVILSPLDLTTGLLGSNVWGVLGFEKEYSMKLAKNLILWSATGIPEEP